MPALSIPNTFSNNTVADATAVNANFNSVATLINSTKLDSSNIQAGGIATAALADASIIDAKLAVGAVSSTKIANQAVTATQIADSTITLTKLADEVLPAGMVVPYAAFTAPNGWLLCNGLAVSRTTYARLFAIIGVTHGSGDNVSTFNLPDYRGRFLRGWDSTANNDPDHDARTAMAAGGLAGNNIGSIQGDAFASHTHQIGFGQVVQNLPISLIMNANSSGGVATGTTSAAGSTSETRPKNAAVNFIIKV